VRTVETHVSRLLGKLGASDRRSAVDRARDLGLLDDVPATR
jgi:DNA-binding NarL/FixJ family response regulator